jgi:competence protein ComEC
MVGISPQILWDAAFQLSFTAMAGLIFIFPQIQSLGRKVVSALLGEGGAVLSAANFITDSFSVTMAAIIAVWPLIAYYFGIISFVAPLATFSALPALPGIIITGVLAAGLGLVALPLGYAVGWLAWFFLSYMLLVVNGFAALPLAAIEVGSVDTILIWVYYSALALVIWLINNRKKLVNLMSETANFVSRLPKKWVMPPLLVVAILVWLTAATMPDDRLHVSFLDVGQGDAILIQKGNQQVLVDGGPSPQAIGLGLGEKMPFWDRTIELVVLTHPSADHIAGLVEVLNRYEVKQVLYPDLDFKSEIYDEWLRLLEGENIECTIAQAGQQVDLGEGVVIEVLNPAVPFLSGTESDVDNNGVVLRLYMGKVSFLLTADTMWEAEFELIARRANLASTVLKVAHHGSNTSTTTELLAAVNPQLAVISVGEDNRFGHPTDEVMTRLIERIGAENIYRTDKQDTVEFITNGERLWVKVD